MATLASRRSEWLNGCPWGAALFARAGLPDVANLAVFLASGDARYITGQQIQVDAGAPLKWVGGLPA